MSEVDRTLHSLPRKEFFRGGYCSFCGSRIEPATVEWIDESEQGPDSSEMGFTPVCPKCKVDAVFRRFIDAKRYGETFKESIDEAALKGTEMRDVVLTVYIVGGLVRIVTPVGFYEAKGTRLGVKSEEN